MTWLEIEEAWEADRQRHADRVRLRGYGLAVCSRVDKASQELERAKERVAFAQEALLVAMRDANAAHAHLEDVMRVIASDDDAWIADVATNLEACFG